MKLRALMLGMMGGWALMVAGPVLAQDGGSGYPWFGSLKKHEVNVRSGPGNPYPILWVYQRANYPVEVLARYDNYYKIRDVEGEEGWVYIGMVSRKATALVGGQTPANLSRHASLGSPLVARLAPGVVVDLGECREVEDAGTLCEAETPEVRGWIAKRNLEMVR